MSRLMGEVLYRKSKRAMLLLELLIAMALTMGILTILIGFYGQIQGLNVAMEREQASSFQRLYLATRLAGILPRAVSPMGAVKVKNLNGGGEADDFYFFTSYIGDGLGKPGTASLLFTFDNGVKLDPLFSNHVLARLYVNPQGQLCLAMWPAPQRWDNLTPPPMKHEVLYEQIDKLVFEFYQPPAKEREEILSSNKRRPKLSKALIPDLNGIWRNDWQPEYRDLPAIIRLHLQVVTSEGSENFTLAYPLPNSHQIIIYDR